MHCQEEAMSDVLLHDVPEPLLDALRERAGQHRRSLEVEVLTILEDAVGEIVRPDPVQAALAIHDRLAGSGRHFADSVEALRDDRAR
jgi:plasmid stability protein